VLDVLDVLQVLEARCRDVRSVLRSG